MEKHWSDVAASQHGVVARRQMSAAGLSSRQIDRLVHSEALVVVYRGVYRLGGAPISFEQRLMAACLAGRSVASHRAAAHLWELRNCDSRAIEVTVVAPRHLELPGVVAHSTAHLARVEIGERRGIPVTAPGRTLVDLGGVADVAIVESALEDALHRGLVSEQWLRGVLAQSGGRGRDGTTMMRSLLDERVPGQRPTESTLEDELVRVLRQGGLPEPVRQYLIEDGKRLDLSYPADLVAMEAQSMLWHAGRADLQRDCEKLNLLTRLGWRLLVFTAFDIRQRPASVVDIVKAARAHAERRGA